MTGRFDRVRRRTPDVLDVEELSAPHDADGKRLLFSSTDTARPMGTLRIECSACGTDSAVTFATAVRLALPSVHLPFVRHYSSYMRCPACGRRTWVRPRLRG